MRTALVLFMALSAFSVAFGNGYEGDPKSVPVTRTGKNLRGETVFPLVVVNTNVYQIAATQQEVNKLVYDCETVEVDGTGGNWDGFWSSPKEFKAVHLMAAIKGLDKDFYTANRLVKDGTFATKPRSWRDFETRIADASSRYGNYFAYHVLVEHKEANMRNLGYLPKVATACGSHLVKTLETVRVRTNPEPKQFRALVRVHGGPLLPSETETFTVTYDGFKHNLTYQSDFNSYQIAEAMAPNGVSVFDLVGTRIVKAPVNTLAIRLSKDGGKLKALVSDENFNEESDAAGQRKIIGRVVLRRHTWDPRSDVQLGQPFERVLSNTAHDTELNDLGIDLGGSLPSGQSIRMEYTLRYENNPYFSSEESSRKSSELPK